MRINYTWNSPKSPWSLALCRPRPPEVGRLFGLLGAIRAGHGLQQAATRRACGHVLEPGEVISGKSRSLYRGSSSHSGSRKLPVEAPALTQARRALTALAIVVGFLSIVGAAGYAIMSARESAENQHTMKCLAAYVAFIEVVGGPEGESIERLKTCERSPIGEEPIHLRSSEHPFVVSKYEACLAAHVLMSADLDKSLAQQQQYCR
jgi:hypothetical protein